MTFDEYQREMRRTEERPGATTERQLMVHGLGLAGEAGEVCDMLKKELAHKHPTPHAKYAKELGDVLWYLTAIADRLSLRLEDIAVGNVEKLRARYPNGFEVERSINRQEGDE